jgi:hypothetical protein
MKTTKIHLFWGNLLFLDRSLSYLRAPLFGLVETEFSVPLFSRADFLAFGISDSDSSGSSSEAAPRPRFRPKKCNQNILNPFDLKTLI